MAMAPISASTSLPGAKKPSRAAIAAPSSTGIAAALREGARIAWIHIANGPGRAPPSFRIADASVMLAYSFVHSPSWLKRISVKSAGCAQFKALIAVSKLLLSFAWYLGGQQIFAETHPDRRRTGRLKYDLAFLQPGDLLRIHPQQLIENFIAMLADSRCSAIVGFNGAELHRQPGHGARTGLAMLPRDHHRRGAKRLVGGQLEGIVHRPGGEPSFTQAPHQLVAVDIARARSNFIFEHLHIVQPVGKVRVSVIRCKRRRSEHLAQRHKFSVARDCNSDPSIFPGRGKDP